MPILRKETEMYPPELFSIPAEDAPWQIVHVRSRQEKAVARLLTQWSQPFYLPQIEKTIRRSGRSFTSFLPLFSGYLFVRRSDETRHVLRMSPAAANILEVRDQRLLDDELRQIRALQQAGATLVPVAQVVPGDRVRIADGVFQGYCGTVIRERDGVRLVVSITALNKSVVADFPRESVTPFRYASRN